MEQITKSLPPRLFQLWYLKETPFPKKWGELPSAIMPKDRRENNIHYYSKTELRTVLFDEQHEKCGYCNQLIRNDESSPIEHLNPRKFYPKKRFDYFNLILSCDGNVKRETDIHVHCDNLKNKNEIPVFPTQRNCENLFIYDEFGNIFSQTAEGKKVIEVLGLDCPFLINRREEFLLDFVYNKQYAKKTSEEYKQSYLETLEIKNKEFKYQILQVLLSFMDEEDRKECLKKNKRIRIKNGIKMITYKIIRYIPYRIIDIRIKKKQHKINYAM